MSLTPSKITELFKTTKRFQNVLKGVVITHLQDGKCIAEMKVCEEHTNPMGGLHGGLSATLVDQISTYALQSHSRGPTPTVSVDIHMTYMKGARLGDEIIIDARTLRAGRTLAFLEVEIKNKTGDLLVKGSHTKFYLDK